MTVDEIVRIAKIAVSLGIARIKLTGGEPLMRKDLPEIVAGIAEVARLEGFVFNHQRSFAWMAWLKSCAKAD